MKARELIARAFPWAATRVLLIRSGCIKPALRILNYHDIAPQELPLLESQLRTAQACGRFIDPAKLEEALAEEASDRFLLTFDDGFKSHRIAAERVLEPLGIRALFFVPSDFIGLSGAACSEFISGRIFDGRVPASDLPDPMAAMDWEDLGFLLARGHRIGSHTRTHRRLLGGCPEEELRDEIAGSKERLERRLGVPVDAFAYPFGDLLSIGAEAVALAARTYRHAFSGLRGPNRRDTPRWGLCREAISPGDGIPYFKCMLAGGLSGYYSGRRRKLRALHEP